jgi:hypothetical protein
MMLVTLMLASCLRVPVSGVDVKTGTAAVNGTKLYYEIHGSGDPVVLLEGGQLDRRLHTGCQLRGKTVRLLQPHHS